jgi:hypothetical protein
MTATRSNPSWAKTRIAWIASSCFGFASPFSQ